MARNFLRRLGAVSFAANEVRTLDTPMPRNNIYRRVHLMLTGTVDTAAGFTTNADFPFNIIRRVEIVSNGSDTIKSIDGPGLRIFQQVNYGTLPDTLVPTVVAAGQSYRGHLIIDFAMPRSVRPIDTLLDARKLSALELRITWGAVSNMGTNLSNLSLTCDVYSEEAIALGGDQNFAVYKQLFQERNLPTTTSEFQMLLPVGNVYRGFLVRTSSDANFDTPAGGIINNIILRSGQEVFFNWRDEQIQAWNKTLLSLENFQTGYHYFDLTSDGHMTEALNTRGFSSLELILDVAGAANNNVRVYPQEIVLPVVVQASVPGAGT